MCPPFLRVDDPTNKKLIIEIALQSCNRGDAEFLPGKDIDVTVEGGEKEPQLILFNHELPG